MDASLQEMARETVDRARRIETRLTRYLSAIGFETGVRKPTFTFVDETPAVDAPSPAVSLADCVAAIPDTFPHDEDVPVFFQERCIGYVSRP